ncbi:HD domain-containing protein [Candidatus Woesebacteria bacterium]|nr:HD domain-containing protein [Candidatus Woesebacteria bacterium]
MKEKETIKISIEALFILKEIIQNGFEAYIVGGAVRDTLIDSYDETDTVSGSDYDFTTSATPEQLQKIFPENFYENDFGTISVTKTHLHEQMNRIVETDQNGLTPEEKTINLNDATKIHPSLQSDLLNKSILDEKQLVGKIEEVYEITTFRSDGEYKNFRKPENVSWGETLESDLSRRDFTINAMAIKVPNKFLESIDFKNDKDFIQLDKNNYEVIDLHNGMADLEYQLIKTVGDPDKRFKEDALRLLRAIRFSVQLNMEIEAETYQSIKTNSNLIEHISWERIRDEFLKMLKSDFPKESIELLDKTGLLKTIMPELLEGKMIMQGGHHIADVWTHNLEALSECPSKDPIIRLATLLHDVAKPRTLQIINDKPTFYNHEIIGSRMAKTIAKRLRLSGDEIEKVFVLVRYHMFHYQPENSDASLRRFMRKVGLNNINDILDLREADRLGSGARKSSWRLEEMKQRMIEQLHQPFSVSDLDIDGNDLMSELNLKPGKIIGDILNQLFEKVLDDPELNKKDKLIELAKEIIKL